MSNRDAFLSVYADIHEYGQESAPRGQKIIEIENYMVDFDPMDPCTSFQDRKFNLQYAKDEFKWYLGADRFDLSIMSKAGTWKTLVDVDGGFNSNYGVYIFGQRQFQWCFEELIRDMSSRRAVIILAHRGQVRLDNPDHICTYAISFRIRNNALGMSVRMRSWDAIFGMTNDVFAFALVHQMMYTKLRDVYPDLVIGDYNHVADSIHVYERHFDMLKKLIEAGPAGWTRVNIPEFASGDEVDAIINARGCPLDGSAFSSWLHESE
jgi:thymidylate synthase